MKPTKKCAYRDGTVSCARWAHKGDYCRAHTPRVVRTSQTECPPCGGAGWETDECGSYPCPRCHGRGKLDVPLVTQTYKR